MVAPLDHVKMNGAEPPVTDNTMAPLVPPLQATLVEEEASVTLEMDTGTLTLTFGQLNKASVISTENVPAEVAK